MTKSLWASIIMVSLLTAGGSLYYGMHDAYTIKGYFKEWKNPARGAIYSVNGKSYMFSLAYVTGRHSWREEESVNIVLSNLLPLGTPIIYHFHKPWKSRRWWGKSGYLYARPDPSQPYVNINVMIVRMGHGRYDISEGFSNEYHREFLEAERHARENKLGVWK